MDALCFPILCVELTYQIIHIRICWFLLVLGSRKLNIYFVLSLFGFCSSRLVTFIIVYNRARDVYNRAITELVSLKRHLTRRIFVAV